MTVILIFHSSIQTLRVQTHSEFPNHLVRGLDYEDVQQGQPKSSQSLVYYKLFSNKTHDMTVTDKNISSITVFPG